MFLLQFQSFGGLPYSVQLVAFPIHQSSENPLVEIFLRPPALPCVSCLKMLFSGSMLNVMWPIRAGNDQVLCEDFPSHSNKKTRIHKNIMHTLIVVLNKQQYCGKI